MRVWPVPDSYQKSVPASGQPGSFWENRGDRHHAGVDIYAPAGSPVLALEDGVVQAIRPFTSTASQSYWHNTLEILIRTDAGVYHRYAELEQALTYQGEKVKAGTQIGLVGCVLNPQGVTGSTPGYVRYLIQTQKLSMLHFEMYTDIQSMDQSYSGGNYYLDSIPVGLFDPSQILESIYHEDSRS